MGYTWFGGRDFPTSLDRKKVAPLNDVPAEQLCLSTYLHPRFMADEKLRNVWVSVAENFASVRMLGAGCVDLSTLADGTMGAWMKHTVPEWDWRAGRRLDNSSVDGTS